MLLIIYLLCVFVYASLFCVLTLEFVIAFFEWKKKSGEILKAHRSSVENVKMLSIRSYREIVKRI